jgi:hypothetical protein
MAEKMLDEKCFYLEQGSSFFVKHYDDDLDIAEELLFLFKVPNIDILPIISFVVEFSNLMVMEFYENPTITDDGSPEPIIARNRNNVRVPNLQIFNQPTISVDGDELLNVQLNNFGIGMINSLSFGNTNQSMILAKNKNYLLRVTTLVDNNKILLSSDFYEKLFK